MRPTVAAFTEAHSQQLSREGGLNVSTLLDSEIPCLYISRSFSQMKHPSLSFISLQPSYYLRSCPASLVTLCSLSCDYLTDLLQPMSHQSPSINRLQFITIAFQITLCFLRVLPSEPARLLHLFLLSSFFRCICSPYSLILNQSCVRLSSLF